MSMTTVSSRQGANEAVVSPNSATHQGLLIVNADDWGRDRLTTDRILDCALRGTVSSASAMVFMEDSERAAGIAQERGIDTGLHLNFTTAFSHSGAPADLKEKQSELGRYLLRHRLSAIMFHPGLMSKFEYVTQKQLDEYRRIYGAEPARIDGHHHMHLCANVRWQRLLPAGTIVRRNFSFDRGEKSLFNRQYRRMVDRSLARRHRLPDYFFSLPPLKPQARLQKIYSLAQRAAVEVETHPVNADEYQYLVSGEMLREIGDVRLGPASRWDWQSSGAKGSRG